MQERHLRWLPHFFPWPRSVPPPSFFILESPLRNNSTEIEESDNEPLSFLKYQDLHSFPASPVHPLGQQCDSDSERKNDSPRLVLSKIVRILRLHSNVFQQFGEIF